VPLWQPRRGLALGEIRENSYISIGNRFASLTARRPRRAARYRTATFAVGGAELARTGKEDHQEAVVVDQLLKKLRPFDRTYVAEREHAYGRSRT
jgi:hypothetical protein